MRGESAYVKAEANGVLGKTKRGGIKSRDDGTEGEANRSPYRAEPTSKRKSEA